LLPTCLYRGCACTPSRCKQGRCDYRKLCLLTSYKECSVTFVWSERWIMCTYNT